MLYKIQCIKFPLRDPLKTKKLITLRACSPPVQFSSVHFSSIQFSSVQFNSIQISSVQFSSALDNTFTLTYHYSLLFSSIQFSSIQFSSIQFISVQFSSTVLCQREHALTCCEVEHVVVLCSRTCCYAVI